MTEDSAVGPVKPTISILLPTYNGARYLPEQLNSILQQTWRDFELLVVDDGSTDSSEAILAEYAERDERVRLVPSEGNRGQKARLAELLGLARGEWIAIADQDDIWALDKTQRLVRSAGTTSLAFGRSELIDELGERLNRSLLDVLNATRRRGDRLSLLFRPQVSGHAMIVRREVLTADLFDSEAPFDWLASLMAEFSQGLVYDDKAVVFHRMHGSNSHNVNVLVRFNLLRLRPHHLRELITLVHRRRRGLRAGLQHLSTSTLIPAESRVRFQRLAQLCETAWFTRGAKLASGRLLHSILDILEPMKGSDDDWRTVVDHVTLLTHGLLHPKILPRLRRVL